MVKVEIDISYDLNENIKSFLERSGKYGSISDFFNTAGSELLEKEWKSERR